MKHEIVKARERLSREEERRLEAKAESLGITVDQLLERLMKVVIYKGVADELLAEPAA